ncbi:integrase [Bacillus toyonensis]|nr:integrase [Bacillus toyonensis]HDR7471012.1 integrase [Bacillus toyonensis]
MTEFELQLDNFMLYCSSKNLLTKTLKSYDQTLNGGEWVSLSRIFGHSSVEVTQKGYLDFTDSEIGKKYQKHSPLNPLKV